MEKEEKVNTIATIEKSYEQGNAEATKDLIYRALVKGDLTPVEIDKISRMLNVDMADSLLTSWKALDVAVSRISKASIMVGKVLGEKLMDEEYLASMDPEILIDIYAKTIKIQVDTINSKRRLLAGKDKIMLDPLTNSDRALIDILSRFSPEKQEKLRNYITELGSTPELQ